MAAAAATLKATAAKFLIKATAEGEWTRTDGEGKSGQFRISVDTDLAKVVLHAGPDYWEDWNPLTLRSYSMRFLRGGSHLRIAFELEKLRWKGELELNVFGGFAGKFEGPGGPGKITGAGTVEKTVDHVHQVPRPTKELAKKLQAEPSSMRWEAPACCRSQEGDGKTPPVLLVGIGGPSKAGKSSLAKALAAKLREVAPGREVAIVEQSRYEHSVGSYNCSAEVNEAMYENPSAINWQDFSKAITKAAEGLAASAKADLSSVVIVEGLLVFWMPQLCQAFHRRLFLRTSRSEVLRRRNASAPVAEPFAEHIFWPMHLQYGQPQAPWEDVCIEDGEEGHPLPDELLSEAFGLLDLGSSEPSPESTASPAIGATEGTAAPDEAPAEVAAESKS